MFYSRFCHFKRLNTDLKGTIPAATFLNMPKDTIFGKIAAKNMDESSFNKRRDSLEKTLASTKHAYYGSSTDIWENKCSVCNVN